MGVSWFGWGAVSSSRPADARAARTAAVKDGRRPPPQAARSVLDGGEHDATLKAAPAKNQPRALSRLTPKGERSLNREPIAKPSATTPFKPFRTDPLNREPTAKPGSTALPARAQDPAPRPGQSGEGSNIRGVALDLASFTRLPCRPATRFSPRPRHRATLPGLAVLPGGNHNGRTRRAAPARPHHY